MEMKKHTFWHALKLWHIWNALADLSLVVFLVPTVLSIFYAGTLMGYE